jgi:hypothetical protein
MAGQNYGAKSLAVVDERYYTESKTGIITNKGVTLTFEGVNTVTIYTVDVVAEVDYQRNGANRFGPLVELGTGTQTFVLSQDKSATWTIDRGNLQDSMMVQQANESMARQQREVAIPNTDKYRFATLAAFAVAAGQSNTTAITASNAYQLLLARKAALVDRETGDEEFVVFTTQTYYNFLRRDPEFKVASDAAYADVKSGVVTKIDGMKIVVIPASYMPANVGYLITSTKVLVSPTKMKMARTLSDVQGIDGWVMEYRRYYDAFIFTNKGKAIEVQKVA